MHIEICLRARCRCDGKASILVKQDSETSSRRQAFFSWFYAQGRWRILPEMQFSAPFSWRPVVSGASEDASVTADLGAFGMNTPMCLCLEEAT